MADRIERNFVNIPVIQDLDKMAKRYENLLNKVSSMIATQGPIYSTWIRFQIGKSSPITFNTASQNEMQNLIASLSMEKTGTGICNSFKLVVRYDPFKNGQNASDTIEILDEFIAKALEMDFTPDIDSEDMRGIIQYGYNYTEDSELVSPKYEYYITGASSVVDWSNGGIITYEFQGTSVLATQSDFTGNFDVIENWGLIDLVNWILYYYYGDGSNPPKHIDSGVQPLQGSPKYNIEIAEELFEDQPKISKEAVPGMTAFSYCRNVLQDQMSAKDAANEKYQDPNLKSCQKPRYILYITDTDGAKTIRVEYISPLDEPKKINFNFTWGLQSKNIIERWEPEADLRFYILQKALYDRNAAIAKEDYSQSLENAAGGNVEEVRATAAAKYKEQMAKYASKVYEVYDATLTTIGIPADIPLSYTIQVTPRILESVSRTAGTYMINGATDTITTGGTYSTTLKLQRIIDYKSSSDFADAIAPANQQPQRNTGGGGDTGGTGTTRNF